jgi:cysteinyl-tRNA synthetase
MDDDLNISGALGVLFDTLRDANSALDANALPPPSASALQSLFTRWDTVLGILAPAQATPAALPPEVQTLLDQRASARASKDWPLSDALRAQLQTLGYLVKDTPKGQVATPIQ